MKHFLISYALSLVWSTMLMAQSAAITYQGHLVDNGAPAISSNNIGAGSISSLMLAAGAVGSEQSARTNSLPAQ